VFSHLLVPLVGIAVFVPAWLTAMGITVFEFVSELAAPASYTGLIVGVWVLLGLVYLAVLYARDPQRIRDTGRVFEEEELAEPAGPPRA
jgi:hypothetical protein